MNPISRWFERRRVDSELAAEMREHLEEKVQQLMRDGQSESEARAEAQREFGNVTLRLEESREAWGWTTAEQTLGDIRFAFRMLRKSPAFTVAAIVVLALGIGANTAMFSVVKAVLLAKLPYPHPGQVVQLWETRQDGGLISVSGPNYRDWAAMNRSMEFLAGFEGQVVTFAGDFTPKRVRLAVVAKDFFKVFGVEPLTGRTFVEEEQKIGGTQSAVISLELAESSFGGADRAIGKSVRFDGMSFNIVGVMPAGFDAPQRSKVWIPLELFPDTSTRSAHNYKVFGRVKPGMTLAAAQNDMNTVAARLSQQYIDDKDRGIRVVSLHEQIVGPVRPALLILLGAVGFVLLIACANIANLQVARGSARLKELALRAALGAGRRRLIRQLLTESLVLSVLGGLLGLILALAGTDILRSAIPANIPRTDTIGVDGWILAFTAGLSVLAGLVFGVLPAIAAARTDVNDSLKEGSGKATAGPRLRRFGGVLVAGEVAIAMILLAGAGLLIESFWKMQQVDPGFRPSGVILSDISWPVMKDGEPDGPRAALLTRQLLDRVRALPGVESAGMTNALPISNQGPDGSFEIEGRPLPANPHDYPDAWYRVVSPGYFETMGIALERGRLFDDRSDLATGPQTAIVSRTFVKVFFPGAGAIGKRIRFLGFDRKPQFMEIVGVVNDVRSLGLGRPVAAEVFANGAQHEDSVFGLTLVVRGPANLAGSIRGVVAGIDRDVPVTIQSMREVISESMARQRFQMSLLAVFAGIALILAVVGIYGVLSYTVSRRTAELGIRMALGASRGEVLRMVLRDGLVMIGAGLGSGIACALLMTRLLSDMLYGVTAADPATYAAITVIFALAGLLACYFPARRAARTDPLAALRYE